MHAGLSSSKLLSKLPHHHLLELVEVHGPRPILVHLLHDVVEVLLSQGAVNLPQDVFQHIICDESLALKKRTLKHLFCQFLSPLPDKPTDLFVVNPESLLQFLLHLFLIVLYHELCCNLRG